MIYKRFVILIAFIAISLPAAAEAEKTYKYKLFWSGFSIGEMNLVIEESDDKYSYTANIESQGILDYFMRYKSSNNSQGTKINNKIIPEKYSSYWTRKKHSQNLVIDYEKDDVAEVTRIPENRKKHPDVPDNLLEKTFDPVAAGMQAMNEIRNIMKTNPKLPTQISVPVYDAKRRFDANITILGYKMVNVGGKKQDLLHLKLSRTPVAGFRANKLKEMLEGEGDPDIEMFLNKDFIPVWGYGKAERGTATIKLTSSP